MGQFTKRQWLTLIVISIADFANAICVSLQAPFYPKEAASKGASATEYGLVFGIFELVVFLISPIYGKHINHLGPRLMFNGGILTTGTCAIFFGLLDRISEHYTFIILSFVIRIIEALGNAAFLTASFSIIAKEFPNNVATTFASLETFFGLGLIVGPTVGGFLYDLGGFEVPFVVLGFALFLAAILTAFVLPNHDNLEEVHRSAEGKFMRVLQIPGVMVAMASIVVTSMSIGFLQATLEPHLRQFNLKPVTLGLMFVINGGTYALTAPAWGWLCDKHYNPKVATVAGCMLVMVGFGLIGPIPYIPYETSLELAITGLVIHGLGMAAQLVASFTDALRLAISHGFPNNLETYGLVSGLWTSTFALGAFIGPSMGGILFDYTDFRRATLSIVVLHLIVGIVALVFLVCCTKRSPKPYVPISAGDELRVSLTESGQLLQKPIQPPDAGNGGGAVPIDRPSCMNSLIACNSYSNKANAWSRASYSGRYSYGSFDHSRKRPSYLDRTT